MVVSAKGSRSCKIPPMDINAIVNDLRDQLDRINRAIHALEGSSSNGRRGRRSGATLRASNGRKRKRRLSTAARKRISEAAKARWAKAKKAGRSQL